MNRDLIHIEALEVHCCVGVPESERARPQRLEISIEMQRDLTEAGRHDNLAETIDYEAVCRQVQAHVEGRCWRLIETVAQEVADLVLAEFAPDRVSVEVRKFILPETRYVAVRISRG